MCLTYYGTCIRIFLMRAGWDSLSHILQIDVVIYVARKQIKKNLVKGNEEGGDILLCAFFQF